MSRSERLFALLQALRRHRRPVSGRVLAEETGVSLRTLYRDIASLQAQGAGIEGEAGLGYVLKPGFLLPPLMFSPEEIEALVLGARWVANRGDDPLQDAARNALARISAVLPPELRETLEASPLLVGPGNALPASSVDLAVLRQAIRTERRLSITYRSAEGTASARVIWPFALSFFDHARVVIGWCELREAFRHFRTDRIDAVEVLDDRYPRRRQALLRAWREAENIPQQRMLLP
ncbi:MULTISPECIES: helix-turn-helix transcriptional regulator [unclassified Shinella]|jgi:predicted DNA-binding transcriptional regulator YafY|uniref:helix-turn-helix transcriptional regulator n=1 Tax=unclassified Shinella TaxID=2643062 RepID=UPI0003C564AC|nr:MULTISPECIES: YafY family protein [unclassified Shinella]MCA0344898.1 YafY family transcriptional regulator [Pseudomonadota bacterium]EYR79293.1 putative transcriptional regulator [Shinella sp. DD12]KNY15830.1 DNA-binding protein [Shinella sp. SUS2]KOC75776.1 DNA-binding protein [Shinella sp. GWS1]MCO5151230.1 YafY family transcriptional regulator [Shinella sp.]